MRVSIRFVPLKKFKFTQIRGATPILFKFTYFNPGQSISRSLPTVTHTQQPSTLLNFSGPTESNVFRAVGKIFSLDDSIYVQKEMPTHIRKGGLFFQSAFLKEPIHLYLPILLIFYLFPKKNNILEEASLPD